MSPFALLPFLALFALPHPHHPKAMVMHGAAGKVATVNWFTVPYNAEQVKTLPNGRSWHLGFAMIDVAATMKCGDVSIPPGKYKLNALRDDKGEFSELQLVHEDLYSASRRRRRQQPDPDRIADIKKDLAARGIPELIRLPAKEYEEDDAEHLEFLVMNRGYEAVKRGSSEPKGGASFTLMATFGNLHRKITLQEVFEPAAEKDGDKE